VIRIRQEEGEEAAGGEAVAGETGRVKSRAGQTTLYASIGTQEKRMAVMFPSN
jgi:hypothetical protein